MPDSSKKKEPSSDSESDGEETTTTTKSTSKGKEKTNQQVMREIKKTFASKGPKDFKKIRLLGKGGVGLVYLVQLNGTDKYYAMKVLEKEEMIKRNKVKRVLTEREVLETVKYPFIVSLYYSFQSLTRLYFVMDYCAGGEFYRIIQKQPHKCLTEDQMRFYAAEVLLALEYLHVMGFVYRDLKPENILMHASGHIRLTDFDLSKASITPVNAQVVQSAMGATSLVAEPSVVAHSFVGTEEYLAPEVLVGKGYGASVDWWTFGILMFEMLYGSTPFRGKDRPDTFHKIEKSNLKFPEHMRCTVSKDCKSLIKKLLSHDPKKRLGHEKGAAEIKAHPFFSKVNWQLLLNETPPIVPELNGPLDLRHFSSKLADDDKGADDDLDSLRPEELGPNDHFKDFQPIDRSVEGGGDNNSSSSNNNGSSAHNNASSSSKPSSPTAPLKKGSSYLSTSSASHSSKKPEKSSSSTLSRNSAKTSKNASPDTSSSEDDDDDADSNVRSITHIANPNAVSHHLSHSTSKIPRSKTPNPIDEDTQSGHTVSSGHSPAPPGVAHHTKHLEVSAPAVGGLDLSSNSVSHSTHKLARSKTPVPPDDDTGSASGTPVLKHKHSKHSNTNTTISSSNTSDSTTSQHNTSSGSKRSSSKRSHTPTSSSPHVTTNDNSDEDTKPVDKPAKLHKKHTSSAISPADSSSPSNISPDDSSTPEPSLHTSSHLKKKVSTKKSSQLIPRETEAADDDTHTDSFSTSSMTKVASNLSDEMNGHDSPSPASTNSSKSKKGHLAISGTVPPPSDDSDSSVSHPKMKHTQSKRSKPDKDKQHDDEEKETPKSKLKKSRHVKHATESSESDNS